MNQDDAAIESWRGLRLVGMAGAALAILLGLFAPQGGALWRVPERLREQVATALLAGRYPGVEVTMDGQLARLSGLVEDEASIARARRAALSAAGPGGPWAGGVTGVDVSGLSVGAMERPFAWSARLEPTRIVLTGAAPSERTAAALKAAAARTFPNRDVVSEMHVAGGAPSPDFAAVAGLALARLGGLNGGEARIVDAQIAIIGDGGEAGVAALRAAFADPPAPFRVRLAVTVDGLDPTRPELQGLNLNAGDPEDCRQAFGRLLERNVITFASGSAAIDPSSQRLLDSLADVSLRCDRFTIEVAGHTDNAGARAANMALSNARANAVAEYLAGQGVVRARLQPQGYGPDRPRMANSSEAGRAANRRIEFNVSQ
jgi:OmpA-OmpF porin, OOP family